MKSQDFGKFLLRVTVGGLLLFHGISKLTHGIAWMAGPLAAYHLPAWISYGVFVGEVVAPIFLILGLYTRLAGLAVSIDLFMAIVLVSHTRFLTIGPGGGWGMELDVFYLMGGLSILFLGSGRFGLQGGRGKWN